MKLKSIVIVLVSTLPLCACLTTPPAKQIPEALMAKVPQALPPLHDGTAGDVALTMADWAAQYHDCRTLQWGLIDALRVSP